MTLQAWRSLAGKESASHLRFRGSEWRQFLGNIGDRLHRKRLEKAHQLLNFYRREVECRHAGLQVITHAVAVGILLAQGRIGQEARQPFRTYTRAFGNQARRQLAFAVRSLVLRQGHQHRLLARR